MNQTHNTQDDARLVMRVLNGEREAFTPLLLRYAPSAAHLCTTLLGKSHEAQDIAQDAAIQAFLGLSRLREPARFGAWFHAIAANLARSALRRRRDLSLHQLTEDATAELLWQKVPPGVEAIHEMREVHDQIMSALNELSAINRQTVIGFYLQGYSYLELAQLLGTSVGTVKGRLFQGRRQLQLALRPLADTVMQPDSRRKKDSTMSTSEPIKLHVDSLRSMLLTRQQFVILRTESGSWSHSVENPINKFAFHAGELPYLFPRSRGATVRPSIDSLFIQHRSASYGLDRSSPTSPFSEDGLHLAGRAADSDHAGFDLRE